MKLLQKRSYQRTLAFFLLLILLLGTSGCQKEQAPALPPVSVAPSPVEPEPEPTISTDDSEHESFASLYSKNSDTVGWIRLDGTKTNNVVMRNDDNYYYLDRKFDGRRADSGELYIDAACHMDKDSMSQNITIHGHHMINGTMFGQLKKYQDINFYKQHPTFRFDSMYRNYTWKVFAVFIVDLTRPDFFYYPKADFASGEEFMSFVDTIQKLSMLETSVDVVETDHIVCLSTCTYVSDNARLVVAARRVREYESLSVDVEQARRK